jgi:ADP-ribosylglycohydrolase
MLGAIIGDIVGSRFEFNPTNDYDFELFSDQCDFTDDTICTIAVADALLKGRAFGESLHDWCKRFPHPKGGYGGRFAQWVRSDNPRPYDSFGNGSAMRVSPVAWYYEDEDEMLRNAELSAACTHNHPEGIKGATAVALAIYDIRHLPNTTGQDVKKKIMMGLKRAVDYAGYNVDVKRDDVLNRFDETCQGTVPVAFWIILNSTSFEDAIRKAVSLGADADTLGAIVGSIAEVIWDIPDWIKAKATSYLPTEMQTVVTAFYRHTHPKSHEV